MTTSKISMMLFRHHLLLPAGVLASVLDSLNQQRELRAVNIVPTSLRSGHQRVPQLMSPRALSRSLPRVQRLVLVRRRLTAVRKVLTIILLVLLLLRLSLCDVLSSPMELLMTQTFRSIPLLLDSGLTGYQPFPEITGNPLELSRTHSLAISRIDVAALMSVLYNKSLNQSVNVASMQQ